MRPAKTDGETRAMCRPADWDPALDGDVGALSIRDETDLQSGQNVMISTWVLDPGDLIALASGAPIHLKIFGRGHPVVSVYVGEEPTEPSGVEP